MQVCGTDGVTYENICELRTQSANARIDYRGECIDTGEDAAGDVCDLVRSSGRCTALPDDCTSPVSPGDGCCPICGMANFISRSPSFFTLSTHTIRWGSHSQTYPRSSG